MNRIQIYRNLNKPGVTYSVRDKKTRLVMGYVTHIALKDVTFHVNESGRQRVIATKRKNVHAFIEGTIDERGILESTNGMSQITYNPFLMDTFCLKNQNKTKLYTAKHISINEKSIIIISPNENK